MKGRQRVWLVRCVFYLSLFNAALFFALRPMWSGIIAILGQPSPYIIFVVMLALAAASAVLRMLGRRPLAFLVPAGFLGVFFLAVEGYIISVMLDSWRYYIREFAINAGVIALIAGIIWLIFYMPKTRIGQRTWFKVTLVVLIIAVTLWGHSGIRPNCFTSTPVVYAVGDEYQIVFTTAMKGTAWVDVGGVVYDDSYAGSRESEQSVHKICVPMDALDAAGEYVIATRAMYLRGPYCALQGKTLTAGYSWRGVDVSDGLNYYVVSDTHTDIEAPANAASYFGDALDMLICCGDTANWLDRPADSGYILQLAGAVTGGSIPVIYARGNHETKGLIANDYYRYVGVDGQKYYYTFRIGSIWGVVLDIGEDHDDDWSEFFGSSRFDSYRAEQTAFLDDVIASADTEYAAEGVDYRIAVCHIPVTFEYREDHASVFKHEWIERLNQMQLTVMFGGHRHQLMYIDPAIEEGTPLIYHKAYAGYDGEKPDGYITAAEFPAVLVSRKSDIQQISKAEDYFAGNFIGLAVSSDGESTTMRFTDQDGHVIDGIMSPWFADISYGDAITVPNK